LKSHTALHLLVLAEAPLADDYFALAELSGLRAQRTGKPSYFLASALYAYAFLFPEGAGPPEDPYDPRLRQAADLYNRGVAAGLAAGDDASFVPRAGTLPPPPWRARGG
jgi:hypothetical protein